MQWTFYWTIAVLCLFVFFNILQIVYTRIEYNKQSNSKFSYLRNFSFETQNFKPSLELLIYRIATIGACFTPILLSAPLFGILKYNTTFDFYSVFAYFLLIISYISCGIVFYISTADIKKFTSLMSMKLLSSVGACGILFLGSSTVCFSSEVSLTNNIGFYYACFALTGLILLIFFVMFLNPKFYTWYQLEKGPDGTYQRPKIVYLAAYEWLVNCINIVLFVLLAVFILIK